MLFEAAEWYKLLFNEEGRLRKRIVDAQDALDDLKLAADGKAAEVQRAKAALLSLSLGRQAPSDGGDD